MPGPFAHLTDHELAVARKAIDELLEAAEREVAAGWAEADTSRERPAHER